MKILQKLVVCVAVLAAPALSFAQPVDGVNGEVTRAQVRADLVRLEQAGYDPAASGDANYPDDVLAAEAKVSAEDAAVAQQSGMGGVASSTSHSGGPMRSTSPRDTCVGPAGYCSLYFGS
jgi:hypothetical protein